MSDRAWRARLSLTPDELRAVHSLVDIATAESEEKTFWDKLLGKVENAMERVPGGRYLRSPPGAVDGEGRKIDEPAAAPAACDKEAET